MVRYGGLSLFFLKFPKSCGKPHSKNVVNTENEGGRIN